jgi:hypothetical protein
MHQTRKGKQWYFGMKIHIGADVNSGPENGELRRKIGKNDYKYHLLCIAKR